MRIAIIIITILIIGCTNNKAIQIVSKSAVGDGYINRAKVEHVLSPEFVIINGDGTIKFNIFTEANDLDKVNIVTMTENQESQIEMKNILEKDSRDYWSIEVETKSLNKYYFILEDENTQIFVGEKITSRQEMLEPFKLIIDEMYDNKLIGDGEIWYEIFVDRFHNGDKTNDPLFNEFGPEKFSAPIGRFENGFERRDIVDRELWGNKTEKQINFSTHSWNSSWFNMLDWEKEIGKETKWASKNTRHYGGDLQGIIDKFEYLNELGITGLWLSPVFYSYSNHKFDIMDYSHIDPTFGNIITDNNESEYNILKDKAGDNTYWTSSDRLFQEMINEAHKQDMKVLIDIVFEYVSDRFWAFEDILIKGQNSPYIDWFIFENLEELDEEIIYDGDRKNVGVINRDGISYRKKFIEISNNISIADKQEVMEWNKQNLKYSCINGNKDMVVLNLNNRVLQGYLIDSIKKWTEGYNEDNKEQRGIDGIVVNYFQNSNTDFIRKLKDQIRDINEKFIVISEKQGIVREVKYDYIFDGYLDYDLSIKLYYLLSEKDSRYKINPTEFKIDQVYHDSIKRDINKYNSIVVLDSYNTDRFISMLANSLNRAYDRENLSIINEKYLNARPDILAEDILKLKKIAVAVLMTKPGNPGIYYGSEVGIWGGDDPDNRKPMIWEEIEYEQEMDSLEKYEKYREYIAETGDILEALQEFRYDVKVNEELYGWYKKLIEIRKKDIELFSKGEMKYKQSDDKKSIFVYKRELENRTAFIAINIGKETVEIKLNVEEKGVYEELISNDRYDIVEDEYELSLSPLQVKILYK